MPRAIQFVLLSAAIVFVVAGQSPAQTQAQRDAATTGQPKTPLKTEAKPAKPTLVGTWRAASLSMALADGSRKTLAASDRPVTLVFSEKTCTVRLGTTVLSLMSYSLDPKQNPWTIDMKSKEEVLLGIFTTKGNNLEISLDDQAKGRPRDFDKQKHSMVFVLGRFRGSSLLVMNADGSNPRTILSLPEYTYVGSPKWSHDSSKIAFDGWRAVMGECNIDAHVFVVKADGSGLKDLGPGSMPSWSPDDKQLTYSQYSPAQGVWTMNADGSDRRQIEAGGWGSRWSPTRNEIAYTVYNQRGAVLCLYDVARHERRELEHKQYQQIFWGFAWSPDGKWIGFKGTLPGGGSEIAALSVEGEAKGLKALLPSSAAPEVANSNAALAWGGDGKQVLVCMKKASDRGQQLYVLDSEGVKPPHLFANLPPGWACDNMAWTSDGKKLLLSGRTVVTQPKKTQPLKPLPKKPQGDPFGS